MASKCDGIELMYEGQHWSNTDAQLTCQPATALFPSGCDSRCPPYSTVRVTAVSLLTETCPQRPAWLGRQAGEHTHTDTLDSLAVFA